MGLIIHAAVKFLTHDIFHYSRKMHVPAANPTCIPCKKGKLSSLCHPNAEKKLAVTMVLIQH
jgi:hypothetical protein